MGEYGAVLDNRAIRRRLVDIGLIQARSFEPRSNI